MATIAAGSPFLETLADAYFDGSLVPGLDPLGNPVLMHETTICLPTRRAAKTLSALFADRANPKATLLPIGPRTICCFPAIPRTRRCRIFWPRPIRCSGG
ncbi:MAG: hypothetical protein NTZ22_08890 [Hyphomicrobiales bacterium]|nr:hypothetical protein [Hyphomicrobiales bacterium]